MIPNNHIGLLAIESTPPDPLIFLLATLGAPETDIVRAD
jgi:hypothetical protein